MRLILIALTAGLFFGNSALAQSSSDPLDTRIFKNGWWVGAGVGYTDLDADDIDFDDDDFGGFGGGFGGGSSGGFGGFSGGGGSSGGGGAGRSF